MHLLQFRTAIRVVALTGIILTGGLASADDGHSETVFRGEVRVDVVDLFVSVVDQKGQPVTGLKKDDFEVTQDGDPVDLTFFAAWKPGATEGEAASIADRNRPRLILLFDRMSLEKKARKRSLEALGGFLERKGNAYEKTMVAIVGNGVEVLQPFTDDPGAIRTAMETVRNADFEGDAFRSRKRQFNRAMSEAQTVQVGAYKPGSTSGSLKVEGLGIEDRFGSLQADGFLGQVNQLRDAEYNRILRALIEMETVVRGTAGTPGRRDIVWIGEDLYIKPGVESYTAFFEAFQRFSSNTQIEQPEIWASEKDLARQFETLAFLCQGLGAAIHVLDASDQGRFEQHELINRRRLTNIPNAFNLGDQRNQTFRQGGSKAQNLIEGGRFLSGATGGVFRGGSRDVDQFFELLEGVVDGTYWIGYTPASGLDGQVHEIELAVNRPGLRVYSAERIPADTVHHRLANRAAGEMLLPRNEDPIGFSVQPGGSETRDDGKTVQTYKVIVPTETVVFAESGDQLAAELTVGVVMQNSDGSVTPPSVFPLAMAIPKNRFRKGSRVAGSFRLLIDRDLKKISVALRDELSGLVGCRLVDVE